MPPPFDDDRIVYIMIALALLAVAVLIWTLV
jgi:hypothetical protein